MPANRHVLNERRSVDRRTLPGVLQQVRQAVAEPRVRWVGNARTRDTFQKERPRLPAVVPLVRSFGGHRTHRQPGRASIDHPKPAAGAAAHRPPQVTDRRGHGEPLTFGSVDRRSRRCGAHEQGVSDDSGHGESPETRQKLRPRHGTGRRRSRTDSASCSGVVPRLTPMIQPASCASVASSTRACSTVPGPRGLPER